MSTLARGGTLMASGRDRRRLQEVLCEIAREALGAQHVCLVSPPAKCPAEDEKPAQEASVHEASALESLSAVAAHVAATNRLLMWPAANEVAAPATPQFLEKPDKKWGKILQPLWRRIGEAPAVPTEYSGLAEYSVAASDASNGATATLLAAPISATVGALVAVGRARGGAFTLRDALLLETLAEQAKLAFENVEYYERLQGRVEAADRALRETYDLLAEQSTKLIAAVENIDSAMIVTNPQGEVIFVNSISRAILRAASPSLGDHLAETLRAHGLGEIAALLEAHGSERRSCEVAVSDGETLRRVLVAQLTPLETADNSAPSNSAPDGSAPSGPVSSHMLIVSDITAERDLDQMKTEFVSFVAHELRSPLSTIYGYASLLQTDGDRFSSIERAQMTASITNQCKRLNRVISEMLDVSRMEAGHPLSVNRQPMDLVALCERVLADARATLPPTTRHTLRLQSEQPTLKLLADADRLEQIMTNLVSNAVKYSPEGGDVLVTLAEDEDNVCISVSDQGIGLTPEQMERLFQKYYRARNAQERNIQGTGLGLFLVRQLVEAHGGQITAESTAGQGTTFRVLLPKLAV
jgi:signal transduction histidine kinase